MNFNYSLICNNILKGLPERARAVLEQRFALSCPEYRTLQAIGAEHKITRERVRQIENDSLEILKKEKKQYFQAPHKRFVEQFKNSGGLKKEESLLNEWAPTKFKSHILFLLALGNQFKRIPETENFYSFWTIKESSLGDAKKTIDFFIKKLKEKKSPISFNDYSPRASLSAFSSSKTDKILLSHLELSKYIIKSPDGLYGLSDWPEVNPKGIKDKAYFVFKKERKPLHFTEVACLIDKAGFNFSNANVKLNEITAQPKKTLSQSTHNELIRDPRFVLVGRGLYALKEWGYESGVVKEIILKTLQQSKKPISKEKIIEKVLAQRKVKENTILLNLQDKRYFFRDSQGKFVLKTTGEFKKGASSLKENFSNRNRIKEA